MRYQGGLAERKTTIGRTGRLPITRQCRLLGLARSTLCSSAHPVSSESLSLMRRLNDLRLERPFAGTRMLRSLLRQEGQR